MERNESNKSMFEELFGENLEVTVKLVYSRRYDAGGKRTVCAGRFRSRWSQSVQLRVGTEFTGGRARLFVYQLGKGVGRKVKLARSVKSVRDEGSQTALQRIRGPKEAGQT